MSRRLLIGLVCAACSFGVAACSRNGDTTAKAGAGATTTQESATPLPDISKLVPSVQRQITEQHDWLVATLARPDATAIDRANAHGELGKLFMAAQLPDAAQGELLAAQSLNASDYRWPYYLAHLARNAGDLPKATALFERVLQLRPDDMDALVWLGDVSLSSGKLDVAETSFAHALRLDQNSVSAKYGAGRTALAKGDNQAAVTYLEDVLRLNPKARAAHYPLSQAYAALGDSVKSAEHLRLRRDGRIAPRDTLMVELDSLLQSPQTFESLGIRKLDEEDWEGAAEAFRKGLALAPDSPALHHRLATALSMMKDDRGAVAEFEAAVTLSPDYFPAQYSLGLLAQSAGRHAQAIARFEAALKARPTYTDARLRLASSLRRSGRLREAVDQYTQALATDPDSSEARLGGAMVLSMLHRDREARRLLEEPVTAGTADLPVVHALARLLATSPDDNVRDGRRALELVQQMMQRGRTLELGETYAMTLAELGQFREAQALQRDLISAADRAGLSAIKPRLVERLALYNRADPCRTPWTEQERP
ncbi:MAG: tetratricopeptide repeat protein [Vicinamibacterales bacterium]